MTSSNSINANSFELSLSVYTSLLLLQYVYPPQANSEEFALSELSLTVYIEAY